MRALFLYGSPNRKGNTTLLAERLRDGLMEQGRHEFVERRLADLNIKPCRGCFACRPTRRCVVHDDDMRALYPEFGLADLVVFAVPILWWGMAAQVKLCFDRMTALLDDKDTVPDLKGKRIVLVVAYKFRDCASATIKMFEDFRSWLDAKVDVIEHCAMDGPVAEKPERLQKAFELGRSLGSNAES